MNRNNRLFSYIIIFFAGFSFLIYEVSWNRFLSLKLGMTIKASAIVLSAFMAGFGLGAYIIGNYANKFKKLNKLLGVVLALIGLMSLFNFIGINYLSDTIHRFSSNPQLATNLFFIISFFLLMLPAFFMGGVIPIVSKTVVLSPTNKAKILGNVYAYETLGSAIGGILAGFILLGNLGQNGTVYFAVCINLGLATVLFFTTKYKSITPNKESKLSKDTTYNSVKSKRIALLSTLSIGFTILALQIAWIRVFKTYFTNTSYTFTLITTFVIVGLFMGSKLYSKYGDTIKNNDLTMLKALVLLLVLSVISLFILIRLPEFFMYPFKGLSANAYVRLILIPVIATLFTVLPLTIVSGFSFPLACTMYVDKATNVSKGVGYVLLYNTVGSVMGPLVSTFLLIPFLGVGKAILVIIIILASLTIYISFIAKQKSIYRYKFVLIGATFALISFTIFSEQLQFLPPSVTKYHRKVISYQEKREGTILVVEEPAKGVFGKSTFVNNASVIGSNYDAIKVVKMVGHIPFFSNLKCENALIIGFGIGVTTAAIASHPEVKSIDCVELVPDLTKTAPYYKEFNHGVYNDKRLHVMAGDGRHFLQSTTKKYDLISCDPTHPVLGSGNLYTQEYFQEVYTHLNADGMVSQYLPLHKLRLQDLLGIIKTFHSVFPNSTIWLGHYHALMFGKKSEDKIDFNLWKKNVSKLPKDDFFYIEPYHIASTVYFDSHFIKNLPKDILLNTDDLSYTEFFSFDCFDAENLYKNLNYFYENKCEITSVFTNIENKEKMSTFVDGNKKLTKSIYYALRGEKQKAFNQLQKACLVNPEDKEYPFLVKLYHGKRR